MNDSGSSRKVLKILFSSFVLLFGLLLISNILKLPSVPLWLSAITMIIGLTILSPSLSIWSISLGVILCCFGAFTVLRTIEIITQPWIRYGLGGSLALFGVVQIIYSVKGGTFDKPDPIKPKILSKEE